MIEGDCGKHGGKDCWGESGSRLALFACALQRREHTREHTRKAMLCEVRWDSCSKTNCAHRPALPCAQGMSCPASQPVCCISGLCAGSRSSCMCSSVSRWD